MKSHTRYAKKLGKRPQMPETITIPKQDEEEKTDFQLITYYKNDGVKIVKGEANVPIGYFKAKNEIPKINYNITDNYIGFHNHKTGQTLQMVRMAEDLWYVENLPGSINFQGWIWFHETDTQSVLNLVKLFFDEAEWFDTVNWILKKI